MEGGLPLKYGGTPKLLPPHPRLHGPSFSFSLAPSCGEMPVAAQIVEGPLETSH